MAAEPLQFERVAHFAQFFDKGFRDWLKDDEQWDALGYVEFIVDCATNGARFDCKQLHEPFVLETGEERLAELRASGEEVHLPYEQCIFEFKEFATFALETAEYHGGELSEEILGADDPSEQYEASGGERFGAVEARVLSFDESDQMNVHAETISKAMHAVHEEENETQLEYEPLVIWNGPNERVRRATILMLGVITLLEERLLREQECRPLSDKANRKRLVSGARAVRPYRVLTLNVAEAKRRTRGVMLQEHESPRLHWRRGHWRTLGRLSEFERRTWVRRCLVGDPEKGFVAKHYTLKWQPTIH